MSHTAFATERRRHMVTNRSGQFVIFDGVPTLVDGDGNTAGFSPEVAEDLIFMTQHAEAHFPNCGFVHVDYETEVVTGLIRTEGCNERT